MPQGGVSKSGAGVSLLGVQKKKNIKKKVDRKGKPAKQKVTSGKAKAQQQLGKQINRNIENIIAEKAIKNGTKLALIKPEESKRDTSKQRVKRIKNKIKEKQKEEKKNKPGNLPATIPIHASSSSSSSSSATTPSTPQKEKS